MRVLVTGATGFIGERIVQCFTGKGYRVLGTGRSQHSFSHDNYTFHKADLTSKKDCAEIVKDIDVVIHCAGKAGVWGDQHDYELANVVVTRNLIEACQNVQKFINISSPSIYFDFKDQYLLNEKQRPKTFSNAYAETKYRAEEIVRQANEKNGLRTISLRPRGVIGAGDRNWLPRIIRLRENGRLTQVGSGSNIVDFTSVDNLIDAIEVCFTTADENCGRVYNITNGKHEKLWDVIDYALLKVGLDGKRKRVPTFLAMGLSRLSERYHTMKLTKDEPRALPVKTGVAAYSMTLDISEAKKRLGYSPQVGTLEAVDEFADWWKEQR